MLLLESTNPNSFINFQIIVFLIVFFILFYFLILFALCSSRSFVLFFEVDLSEMKEDEKMQEDEDVYKEKTDKTSFSSYVAIHTFSSHFTSFNETECFKHLEREECIIAQHSDLLMIFSHVFRYVLVMFSVSK